MHLSLELTVNATGQFEGSIASANETAREFSGTLELLRVLEDAVRVESEGGEDAAGA